MPNKRKAYLNYLKDNNLDFFKMSIDTALEVLDAAKKVVKKGKKAFVQLDSRELVYTKKSTKLGELAKDIKFKRYDVFFEMYHNLNKGTYPNYPFQGMLLERVDKPEKPRLIKIPAVYDRIVYSILLERIEPFFLADTKRYPIFGIKGKGVALALETLKKVIKSKKVVLKLDFQSYFDSIPRGQLMNIIRGYCLKGEEMRLIKSAINSPTKIPSRPKVLSQKYGHRFRPFEKKTGLPQGCAFSPLLASIYALDVEKYLETKNIFSIRYIDDIIILVDSFAEAEEVYLDIKNVCNKLGLSIHEPKKNEVNDKSYIVGSDQTIRFLGLDIQDGVIRLPEEKKVKAVERIKEKLSENLGNQEDINYRDSCIISFIIGWTKYYREHSDDWGLHKESIYSNFKKVIDSSEVSLSSKERIISVLDREVG